MTIFPDATQLLIAYLADALGVDVVVESRVPRPRADQFVQVRRIGGPFVWPVQDQPRMVITAWALTEPDAHDLLMRARSAVWAVKRTNMLGVACYGVEEFVGPTSATDDESGQPRWQLTVTLTIRAE